MGKKIDREGTFIGYAMQSGVGETKANKFPQFVAKFQAVQEYDSESQTFIDITGVEEVELTGYFVLFDKDAKPTLNAKQIKKAYPIWTGSIRELNDGDYSEFPVQFRVEENEYKGKKSMQVSWIDAVDAVPGGNVGKMDDAGVNAIEAKYASAIRELQGGDKPKAIPLAKAVTTKKATAKPVVPRVAAPAETSPQAPAEPTNKEMMTEMAEVQKQEQLERAAAAEYKAMSPAEKKAFNKAKREAVSKKKAAVKVPRTPPPPPTTAPPVEEEASASTQQELIDALDLSATCTKGEAWDACEANAHPDKALVVAEVWTKVVKEFGSDDIVETNKAWPEVRSRVLEQIIDELPF